MLICFFFFNDTATTEIYTLSLHDALPIWRMLAYKVAGTVKLVSRKGLDHARRVPGIVAALRKLDASGLILNGEMAVYDAQLVSRFEWLRHASLPDLSTPPLFMVFDCLQARGKDLRSQPLYVRH